MTNFSCLRPVRTMTEIHICSLLLPLPQDKNQNNSWKISDTSYYMGRDGGASHINASAFLGTVQSFDVYLPCLRVLTGQETNTLESYWQWKQSNSSEVQCPLQGLTQSKWTKTLQFSTILEEKKKKKAYCMANILTFLGTSQKTEFCLANRIHPIIL